jgi:hypothetical protein
MLQTHCAPSNRNQFDSLVELQVKKQLYAILLRWLAETGTARSMRREQVELHATMTSWAIYGAAKRWSQSERTESARDFARRALPLVAAGLAADTGKPVRTKTTNVHTSP